MIPFLVPTPPTSCSHLPHFSPIFCSPEEHSFALPACSLACSISLPGIGKETAAIQARNLGEKSTNSKTIKVHLAK